MSLFGAFRKKPASSPKPGTILEKTDSDNSSLRIEVTAMYKRGLNPMHSLMALIHDKEGKLRTSISDTGQLWLGVIDLLDYDELDENVRGQLVTVRDMLAQAFQDGGPKCRSFVESYSALDKDKSAMKYLQSFRVHDARGCYVLLCGPRLMERDVSCNRPQALSI